MVIGISNERNRDETGRLVGAGLADSAGLNVFILGGIVTQKGPRPNIYTRILARVRGGGSFGTHPRPKSAWTSWGGSWSRENDGERN